MCLLGTRTRRIRFRSFVCNTARKCRNTRKAQSDESGTSRDELGKSRDESAEGWDESAARGSRQPLSQPLPKTKTGTISCPPQPPHRLTLASTHRRAADSVKTISQSHSRNAPPPRGSAPRWPPECSMCRRFKPPRMSSPWLSLRGTRSRLFASGPPVGACRRVCIRGRKVVVAAGCGGWCGSRV